MTSASVGCFSPLMLSGCRLIQIFVVGRVGDGVLGFGVDDGASPDPKVSHGYVVNVVGSWRRVMMTRK